jgi:type I restriction enzyme S subunit
MSSWKNTKVGEVVALVSGGTPPRNDPRYWGGQIPWITCKDMKADRLSDSSERLTEAGLEAGSRLVAAGTILIVIRGMILARDVPVALATKAVSFNQDLKALLPKPAINGEFLLYALKSKVRELQQMTARAAHGTKSLLT